MNEQGLSSISTKVAPEHCSPSCSSSSNAKSVQAVFNQWKAGIVDPQLLSELKKRPCYFEIAPLIKHQTSALFQYRIIPTTFSGKADPSSYINKFRDTSEPVAVFPSLSGNLLVAPTNVTKPYHHLQQFLIHAEEVEIKAFFKSWAEAADQALEQHNKVWVSTHGKGTPWLHGRVDSKPIYYRTKEFTV